MTKAEILKNAKGLKKILDDKKAKDIIILDVSGQTPITDIFVIASAESFIHSKALEDYSIDFLNMNGFTRKNRSNIYPENPWILLDYGDIIVHIFMDEAREYYELEKLWHDSKIID